MKMRRACFLAFFALLGASAGASAQSPYVGGSVFADVVRTTRIEGLLDEESPGSGEAVGFTLRAGTAIGANWGVELEYARPSQIKSDAQLVYPLVPSPLADAITIPAVYPPVFPIPLALETRDRHSTVSALVWARQDVSDRIALVYMGGVAFNRFEREYEYGFRDLPVIAGPGLIQVPSFTSRTVTYSTRPVVGFESWIGLTDHVTLTPGVRLLGVEDGWSLRPGVGLAWSF